ncbi:MAG: glutaredoxin 3 [Bdellovibrionales bacterium]|nr:glutaredoxin 3 [Bdellovibrionales bacterium]
MNKVLIYTKDFCPFCVRAKNLLKNKGIVFDEINVEGNDALYEQLKNRTGHRTVPQIFITGQMIGGFTELNQLNETGELDRMLAAGAANTDRSANSKAPSER